MDVAEPRRGRKLSLLKPASYDSETGTSGLSCLNGGPSRGITGAQRLRVSQNLGWSLPLEKGQKEILIERVDTVSSYIVSGWPLLTSVLTSQLHKTLSSPQLLLQGDFWFQQAFKAIFCACDLKETCSFMVLFQKQLIKNEGQEERLNSSLQRSCICSWAWHSHSTVYAHLKTLYSFYHKSA